MNISQDFVTLNIFITKKKFDIGNVAIRSVMTYHLCLIILILCKTKIINSAR